MTFLVLYHVGKEGLQSVVMRDDVNVKEVVERLLSRIEDRVPVADPRVID